MRRPSVTPPSGRYRSRLAALSGLVALAILASGCALIDPSLNGDFGEKITTTYTAGRATMKIGDEAVVLDKMAPAHLIEGIGPEAYWFNDDGWGVRLMGGTGAIGPASITLDRIQTTYWTAWGDNCRVTIDQSDASALRGSAVCTGLRWSDPLRGDSLGTDQLVPGEAAFDATIQFVATAESAPA